MKLIKRIEYDHSSFNHSSVLVSKNRKSRKKKKKFHFESPFIIDQFTIASFCALTSLNTHFLS